MTAAEAADKIGKKAGTIYKYESGKLSVSEEDVVALLVAYGVDLDHAFSDPLPSDQTSRRKNADAKRLRELEAIFAELPEAAKAQVVEVARWAKTHYADVGERPAD